MSSNSNPAGPGAVKRSTKKGFSEEDVNLFLRRGANLASRQKAPGQESISEYSPREKTSRIAKIGGKEVSRFGFKGKFSDMSQEQLAGLATSFKQREQNIAQRRAQPGRSSLFMGR